MTSEEVRQELREMAYTSKGFEEVVTFIWALPDCFWSRVCKRLIATIIVGIQSDTKPQPPSPIEWDPRGCMKSWRE